MTPEVSPTAQTHPWKKAIPEARDRLQSKILVSASVVAFLYLGYLMVEHLTTPDLKSAPYLALALPISLFFALAAWRLKAATAPAALFGGIICVLIAVLSNRLDGSSVFHSGLTPLILLFVLTREATRLGRKRKDGDDDAAERHGRRASQIIANLGGAAIMSGYFVFYFGKTSLLSARFAYTFAMFQIPMLAALAEATADTVSSEVGQAFGGTPLLLTSFRRVAPGTDGAVTLAGTMAGIFAAAIVALVSIPSLGLYEFDCAVILLAAICGLFFDSLLGATIERWGWVGNDWVNFSSSLFSALLTFPLQVFVGWIVYWAHHRR